MKKYLGEIGLFLIAIIWGSGFVGTKLALNGGMTPMQTLTIRYLIGFLILGIVFFKKIKESLTKESYISRSNIRYIFFYRVFNANNRYCIYYCFKKCIYNSCKCSYSTIYRICII